MKPAATVVLPTYNRPHLLERSLRALLAQDPSTPAFEVVVVDDGSEPETGEAVQRIARTDARVSYLRHDTNQGRSATRNTGIRQARGDIVLLVDDDVVVDPGYVKAHLDVHAAAEPAAVAVIGDLRFPAEVVAASNYAKYLQSRYLGGRDPEALQRVRPWDLHPRFLISAVASARREGMVAAGMFDEAIRYYGCEDHIFAERLRRSGVRIVFAPAARALHYDPVTVGWYRAKMHETAREGIPVLLRSAPEFLEQTSFADLVPVDWSRDRPGRVVRKLTLRAVLNPLVIRALEAWSSATDHIGWLYLPAVGRAMSAGWFLQGLGMPRNGPRLLIYGE
jgi:glycosyltransferase involved in cell wall biosynthesis